MVRFQHHDSFLYRLADNSYRALDDGAYDLNTSDIKSHDILDLRKRIISCPYVPIIGEIKYSSPSHGVLLDEKFSPSYLAETMTESGAIAISVLTQPYEFHGSIYHISAIRHKINAPILMKDIVVSDVQINTARKIGADSILFIKSVFDNNLAEGDLENYLDYANRIGLKAVVEVHTEMEFAEALKLVEGSNNILGINNRNLDTLEVDTSVTTEILKKQSKGKSVVISESGISDSQTIRELRKVGADGFLVGTSLVQSSDIGHKLGELTQAL
ncbi:MAG: indole-3-glycerol-phosphate synthase [Nitrososphaeraceae archaeon]|jgi:indole-3-glycerol phosphate synthase